MSSRRRCMYRWVVVIELWRAISYKEIDITDADESPPANNT